MGSQDLTTDLMTRATSGQLLSALLEAALVSGSEACLPVDGCSMVPLVPPGDVVRVRALGGHTGDDRGVRLGNVVAARSGPEGRLLVHRVVALPDQGMVLRGDNCDTPDGVYAPTDILGVVVAVSRKGRNVWFGAGRWGTLVAWASRIGLLRLLVRAAHPLYLPFRQPAAFRSARRP